MSRGREAALHCSPNPVTAVEYQELARFRPGAKGVLDFSEQAARAAGLTPAQHQLLLAVKGARSARPPTIGEVADSLKLRHHSAVELVERAVAARLVVREADADDARCRRLIMTAEGEDKLAGLSALHREELRHFEEEVLSLTSIPSL